MQGKDFLAASTGDNAIWVLFGCHEGLVRYANRLKRSWECASLSIFDVRANFTDSIQ